MSAVPFPAFDADNHYYESVDAFTRYGDPTMARRTMQWGEINGKRRLLVGGKVDHFIPNPTFDPVAKPGALDVYFRAKNTEGTDVRTLFGELEPIRPEYRNRDARVAVLDAQGLQAAFMFPTLAVGMEEALSNDLPAVTSAFHAFNRWVDDDWGLNYNDRLYAAAYISLANVDAAVRELEWALERDVRIVCLRPAPALTENGRQSIGHPDYDPFWARVNEAGITVGFHGGDSGYGRIANDWEPLGQMEAFRTSTFRAVVLPDRAIYDSIAALICHGVFARFANVRVATIETGASWVSPLFKKLKKAFGQMPKAFGEDPIEVFRNHVWVNPYYEDDLVELKNLVGVEHILFGSDWPHAEGLAEPTAFVEDLERNGYTPDEVHLVMRDNALGLSIPRSLTHA